MFNTRVKSIITSFAVALVLGAGPVACSTAPPVMPDATRHFSVEKRAGDYTIAAVDHSHLAYLDGIKLLGGAGPNADRKTNFDVALEVQGVGLQFEKDRIYGYMRVDRTFTNERRVGIRIRFQF